MAFDLATAKPVEPASGGFDPSTAQPVEGSDKQPQRRVTNRMQRFMGVDRKTEGNALEKVGEAIDKMPYELGSSVSQIATMAGASPELSAGAGYATNVALQVIPAVLGGESSKLLSPAMRDAARETMQSALKPTIQALKTGKAARAIDTLLEEGINATKGGVAKMKASIAELNDQIADAIKNSPAVVDKGKVAQYLQGTLDKFSKQVNPEADTKAIKAAWDEFINHPLLAGKQDIPVKLAQEMKQATYKSLGEKSYGELKGADTEAQKTLARGLKEEIATAVPGIGDLNKAESALLNALNVTERRALLDANKNPGGLVWLAKNPEAAIGFMADKSALFKSLLARMLYSGSEQIPANVARAIGAKAGASGGTDE